MSDHYILDEAGNPVVESDYIKWAMWYEQSDEKRRVAETILGDIRVSTIFLSLTHLSNKMDDDFTPYLYETMVFADDAILARLIELSETDDRSIFSKAFGGIDIQKRYKTRQEAEQGHKNMCIFIETCLSNGLLSEKQVPDDQEATA